MDFAQPNSFDEAVRLAHDCSGPSRFLAGGTDVLVQLRSDSFTPDLLIDIKKIDTARTVTQDSDGGWRIGPAVSGAELCENRELCDAWPGVVEAMELIGSTQIQGRATLVGNLCNGSPAADSVPALIAADARLDILGPKGPRQVAVADIPVGPGRTSLQKGELVTALHLPPRPPQTADAYERFIPRTEMDIAVVGCGVFMSVEGEKITQARVVLGAVAPTARLVPGAADALIGSALDDDALDQMSAAARAACAPINDKRGTKEFRIHVAGVMARRVAQTAYARARNAI